MRNPIAKNAALVAGALGLVFAGGASAVSYEYPYLHKDPRALGMGGANIALGGNNGAVFYNPAALSRMDEGFTVDLLPLQLGWAKNTFDFFDAMADASDIEDDDEQTNAILDVLADYRGKNLHAGFSTFPALGWRGDVLAFSFGVLASAKFDARSHQGYGSEGLLEVDARGLYGPVFGLSYRYEDMTFGVGLKSLSMSRVNRTYSARELSEVSDDAYDFDDDVNEGSAVGIDLGFLYDFAPDHYLRPTFGVAVQNLGDMDFGDAGKLPMTTNLGLAIHPEVPFLAGVSFAVDYVDVFNSYEDADFLKRLRMGGEVKLWDHWASTMALRAGLYQGHYTAGADLRLAILTLGFATYAEEVGAYSGQDADRRYLATLSIGW